MSADRRTDPFAAVPAARREGRVGGLRAAWWEAGPPEGRPVVLVHGGGVDEARLSWGALIGPLAEAGHRVVAPDLPGYGGTEGFRRSHVVADLAQYLLSLVDHLGLGAPAFCGISMGGATVLAAAVQRPEAARAVVAVAPYGLLDTSPHPKLFWLAARLPVHRATFALIASSDRAAYRSTARLYADPGRIDADLVPQVRASARRQASRPAFGDFARGELTPRGFHTNLAPALDAIAAPVTLIHGEDDPLVPVVASRAAANGSKAKLHVLPGGHILTRERPEEVRDAILAAIA